MNEISRASDNLGLQGQFTLVARHSSGEIFAVREIMNTITDDGEEEVAQLLIGTGGTAFDYIALGSDSTAASDADTQLAAEITTNGGDRTQSTSEAATLNVASVPVAFSFTGSLTLKEVGLLNAASDGVLFARQVFSDINVGNGDSLTATWNITCGTAR